MKFKENAIKPGMVIHCPKEEDAKVLLEYLESLGYVWSNGANICATYSRWHEHCDRTGYQILDDRKGKITNGDVNSYLCKITEFSDLIKPDDSPMSAAEVLEWFHEHGNDDYFLAKLFDGDIGFYTIISHHTIDEIIQIITAYEATRKEKPVEVELGWRIEVYEENGDLWNGDSFWLGYTREEVESIAKRVAIDCVRQTGKLATWSVIDACKVKED